MTHLKDDCGIDWRQVRIHKEKMAEILRIGLPAGVQGMLFSISNVMIQSSVNTFGGEVVDGNAAAASIDGFIWNAMNAVTQGAITFSGQHVGAKKYKRLNRVVLNCMALTTIVGLLFGAVIFLFAKPLLVVYDPKMTPLAREWGQQRLNLMCATYFLCGLMDVATGTLRGMGKTLTTMLVSVAGVCGIRMMWILVIFRMIPTMNCLYLSYPVTWIVTGAVQYTMLIISKRRMEKRDMCAVEA
jgi:Na+-driven multidrug efflux pump